MSLQALTSGLAGGAIIGGAAASLLLFSGEIMGASGIVNSLALHPKRALTDPSQHWKIAFLSSFVVTTSLYFSDSYDTHRDDTWKLSGLAYALGGLLVGFGTKLGNGCTSGHGICGMARLSKRSITAVFTFMGSAIATAFLAHEMPELSFITDKLHDDSSSHDRNTTLSLFLSTALVGATALAFFVQKKEKRDPNDIRKLGPGAISGALFAAGLSVGQMIYQSRVLGFLNVSGIFDNAWDPTLTMVMGGGLVVSWLSYQFIEGYKIVSNTKALEKPIALRRGSRFSVPNNTTIDDELLLGAACFGTGWGIAGLCPGPAMFVGALGVKTVLYQWWPSYFLGAYLAEQYKEYKTCCD
jgi:hypothetical protein